MRPHSYNTIGISPKLRPQKQATILFVCTFIEVSALCWFWYKPNLTVLKFCMMLCSPSIMVLCFGIDLFLRVLVSWHEDLQTNSTHCLQVILKSRFQFPHWVMKNVLFLKVITIFKLIYLFWLKMKQTLRGFCVTHFMYFLLCSGFWNIF